MLRIEDAVALETYRLEEGWVEIRNLIGECDDGLVERFKKLDVFRKTTRKERREIKGRVSSVIENGVSESQREIDVGREDGATGGNLKIQLTIPFKISLKQSERLIVIGDNGSRNSQIPNLFLGNLRIIHG